MEFCPLVLSLRPGLQGGPESARKSAWEVRFVKATDMSEPEAANLPGMDYAEDQHTVQLLTIEDDMTGMLVAPHLSSDTWRESSHPGVLGKQGEAILKAIEIAIGLELTEQLKPRQVDG
jgi:hypothetical protein